VPDGRRAAKEWGGCGDLRSSKKCAAFVKLRAAVSPIIG
jgi:hypothetical protein